VDGCLRVEMRCDGESKSLDVCYVYMRYNGEREMNGGSWIYLYIMPTYDCPLFIDIPSLPDRSHVAVTSHSVWFLFARFTHFLCFSYCGYLLHELDSSAIRAIPNDP
jgi:hypothetical protein